MAMAAAGIHAQTGQTTPPSRGGTGDGATVTTNQMSGEVVHVEGSTLVVKMQDGGYRVFDVPATREFMIDGQSKRVGDLKPGTTLTATVTTTTQPTTARTKTDISGRVLWVNGNFVVLMLDSGQSREYNVPDSVMFNVNGMPATVHDLKEGMRVSASRIVEEPMTEISTQTVVTGSAPK
jgi:hypothetical protein